MRGFVIRFAIVMSLAAPCAAHAQSRRAPLLARSPVVLASRDTNSGRTTPIDVTLGTTRAERARRGAIMGAVLVGVGAGIIAYAADPVGCDAPLPERPCHPQRERLKLTLSFAGLGAIAGAMGGGAVGALVPPRETRP